MNRRQVLRLAGAAPALLTTAAWGRRATAETVRLGIIGTGSRGGGLLRVVQQVPGYRVAACADLMPFRLERALEVAGPRCRGYDRYEPLLEDPEVDAVIIATPLSRHHRMVVDALDAGKRIYCEKTMTYQISEALDLVPRVRDHRAPIQVGYQYRYHPLYRRVAEMIREGYIGQVSHIAAQWNRNGDWRRPVPEPKWERLINWRMYKEFSGGLLAELSSHQIDWINSIFDSHPVRVTGFGGIDTWRDGRETFDNVDVLLRYPSGMTVSCVCLTANAHDGYRVAFQGSRGTIEVGVDRATLYSEDPQTKEHGLVDGVSGATRAAFAERRGVPITVEGVRSGWDGSHYALAAFHRAITAGETIDSSVEHGARSAISVRLAIDAVRDGGVRTWRDEYSVVS